VTNLFSASKYLTSNFYVLGVWKIQSALMDMTKGPTYFVKFSNIVNDMQAKFDKYWSEYNLALSCDTILDPRYKVTFVKYCFVKIYGSEEYMRVSSCSSGNFTSDDNQVKLDEWAMFVTQEMIHIQMGKSELDLYLGESNHPRNEDLDILDYWFKTSTRYPTLALMACDLL